MNTALVMDIAVGAVLGTVYSNLVSLGEEKFMDLLFCMMGTSGKVKGTFDTKTIKERGEAFVLRTAIVIAEGDCLCAAFGISQKMCVNHMFFL